MVNTLTIKETNNLSPVGYFLYQILCITTDWDIWVDIQNDVRQMRKTNEFKEYPITATY